MPSSLRFLAILGLFASAVSANGFRAGAAASNVTPPLGTSLNFTPLLPLASNPGALVDELDTLLLHDSMSNEMRQSIIAAISAVTPTNALKRVRTAVYLVATSSQYQVER